MVGQMRVLPNAYPCLLETNRLTLRFGLLIIEAQPREAQGLCLDMRIALPLTFGLGK